MGFIAWIILGLVAGAIAKLIMPGKQGGGFFKTLILGVVGAILGGWIGGALFHVNLGDFWSFQTWILAIGGALLVLVIWGILFKSKK